MLIKLVDWWMQNVGGGRPSKPVNYFRAGASEGQYIPMLNHEVADFKDVFDEIVGMLNFTARRVIKIKSSSQDLALNEYKVVMKQ